MNQFKIMREIFVTFFMVFFSFNLDAQSRYVVVHTYDGKTAKYEISNVKEIVFEDVDNHEFVDLGLPSGILWATCNIGASTTSDYGSYQTREEAKKSLAADWGGEWRLPTTTEFNELMNNCTCVWTSVNGVKGAKFTKNGKSVFLPAGGIKFGTSFLSSAGSSCGYNTNALYYVNIQSGAMILTEDYDGNFSLCSRPVRAANR